MTAVTALYFSFSSSFTSLYKSLCRTISHIDDQSHGEGLLAASERLKWHIIKTVHIEILPTSNAQNVSRDSPDGGAVLKNMYLLQFPLKLVWLVLIWL